MKVRESVTRMMLLTKENLSALPGIGGQEKKGDDAIAYVKFFDPCGSWTWWATEYDPINKMFFGLVHGAEWELGYFSLDEIQTYKGKFNIGIERDRHFTPKPLKDIHKE